MAANFFVVNRHTSKTLASIRSPLLIKQKKIKSHQAATLLKSASTAL